MTSATSKITMLGPDFPFAYDSWTRHPSGLGVLPPSRHGTPVAVVGAGVSGLVAAYELMRLGLRPVIYEPGAIGGRMRSVPFPENPGYVAEMGAMRFPESARALFHYIDLLGLRTRPFPNPLTPDTPSTVVNLEGATHRARSMSDLPGEFQEVEDAWAKALQELADRSAIEDAIRRHDVPLLKTIWNHLVRSLDDQSFYGFLANSPSFGSFRHREIFGQVGFGTGGWDTDFPNSILEILRVVLTRADDDQVGIVGGAARITDGLWAHSPETAVHWPAGTSLASLHDGTPLPGLARIRRDESGYTLTDDGGRTRTFPAVIYTPHVWTLLSNVDCPQDLLPNPVWTAIERTHYMGSSKLFVLSDRPFWNDRDDAGHPAMGMTLTDRAPRSVYLFDHGYDRPGVMCLSYTWNDDSAKLSTLPLSKRLDVLLTSLGKIYPGVDIRRHVRSAPLGVTWENEPHFMGAFKANLPGQYRYQRRLYTQFLQRDLPVERGGFFLAGDDVSWTAGFAEGAVTTGLNAVWGVLDRLGGATPVDNPGPGDRFDSLAPVELPR